MLFTRVRQAIIRSQIRSTVLCAARWRNGNREKQKNRKIEKGQWLLLLGFAVCMLLLFWRCFYSVNYADEPYCIGSVWRFYKGDALLAQDWFPAQQLIAWILAPLYGLFRLFSEGNDGILLASRIAYVAFQGIVAAFVYMRLKKYGNFRIPAVLLYLFSTQNNMLTLNYNTLGLGCIFLILTILTTEEVYAVRTLLFVGALTAVMVLSQPYAILMFIVWGILVILALPFGKKRELLSLLKLRTFFFVGLGAALVLVLFLITVFGRADVEEVFRGIPYLMGDPEHQMDLSYKVSKYFERFYRYYRYQILTAVLCLITGMLKEHKITAIMRAMSFLLAVAAAVYALVTLGWISDYVPIDFICVPMMFLGISLWGLSEKRHAELFWGWIFPAIGYTFCVQLTTNTGILAVSSACIAASAGGILLMGQVLKEWKDQLSGKKTMIAAVLLCAVLALQGGLLLYHRMTDTWWSSPVAECTVKLERGPAKGIYTSPEDAMWYEASLDAIDALNIEKEEPVLFLELDPWLYLYTDAPVAAYSMWTIGEENFLEQYYEAYPEKIPQVVCWLGTETAEDAVLSEYFLENGYEMMEMNGGLALRK